MRIDASNDMEKSWKRGWEGRAMGEVVEPALAWAIGAGMDANAKLRGGKGKTLLMQAGSGALAGALIKAGARIDEVDGDGWSALAHAINSGRRDWIMEMMLGGSDILRCAMIGGAWVDAEGFAMSIKRSKAFRWVHEGARAAIASVAGKAEPGVGPRGGGRL